MNRQFRCIERKAAYQILAALFDYPERNLLDSLPLCIDDLTDLLELPAPTDLKQPINLTDLEVAYTGLFINRFGGAPAPPYGSVYLDATAQLMGESCVKVAKSYQAEGLNTAASDEPADYLPTELEFLYYLIAEEEAATEVQNEEAAATFRQKQADFFCDHLSPWLTDFCQRIKQSDSGHPLYIWSADALKLFGEKEQKFFALNKMNRPN